MATNKELREKFHHAFWALSQLTSDLVLASMGTIGTHKHDQIFALYFTVADFNTAILGIREYLEKTGAFKEEDNE